MKWEEPKYSKKQVDKAGKAIANASATNMQAPKKDMEVFHNWRNSHIFPMRITLDSVKRAALKIDGNSISVRRLKRTSSIIEKLQREKTMQLSTMQDIGGCRIIMTTLDNINKLYEFLKKRKSCLGLYDEDNYIINPKISGYRSIHLMYKYNGSKNAFKNMRVELQIRTEIQHSWATAVEVIDTFTKQSLKSGKGEDKWLELFKLISVEFKKLEDNSVENNFIEYDFNKMCGLIKELKLFDRLRMFTISLHEITSKIKKLNPSKKEVYFLIDLDVKSMSGSYRIYTNKDLEKAVSHYNKLDEDYQTNSDRNIVLLSAKSLSEIKKGYPNYFADTEKFERNINKIISIHKNI